MYRIFSNSFFKCLAVFMAMNITLELFFPFVSYALTSGPSQPEVQSFEPVGTSEMVDLFTGDFTYNIPLFELPGPNGGYPFNLHYNSGISMDQEASWVGLGWNLNPGVINRQMRGFPDDFKNDVVQRNQDIRDNVTFGVGVGGGVEIFGGDLLKGSLSLGIGIYYNNYKGVGYSLEPGLSVQSASQEGIGAGLNFGFSMDSQEGIGVNPSLSLLSHSTYNTNSFSLGASYNSRRGLTGASMGFSSVSKNLMTRKGYGRHKDGSVKSGTKSIGGNSSLSFAGDAYSPQVGMPMQGRNVSLTIKTGGSVFGIFGNGYVNGFFNTQYLKNKNSSAGAYGYMYLHETNSDHVLLDFNREKDGPVLKNTPNLATPIMTSDIYSVSGQGISGMYRPYRSDIGTLYDQEAQSLTVGGSGGFDAGIGMPHIGVDLSINYSQTTSGKWKDENNADNVYAFQGTVLGNEIYEPYYFKTYGEQSSDTTEELKYIGYTEPVRIDLTEGGSVVDRKYTASTTLKGKSGATTSGLASTNPLDVSSETLNPLDKGREPRSLAVQPVTNSTLADYSIGEYTFKYYNAPSVDFRTATAVNYTRSKPGHHMAGLTATNPDGTRYVYGLPAYNNTQVECQFTVGQTECSPTIDIVEENGRPNYKNHNNSDKYYNKTTLPAYAHSYLLTSILGADYIDADGTPGPSVGDLGYWVKFNYVRTASEYEWRVPFNGANFNKGYNTTPWDNKGAYTYGTKEIWHVATVESKSHIAVFYMDERKDAKGASDELQNVSDPLGSSSYKLNRISLFSRAEYEKLTGTPLSIKNVHFEYSYELCKNLPNNIHYDPTNGNIHAESGKLTLKKVWFTHENNTRGTLSPYEFNYHQNEALENPDYHTHKYDRWGNYKSYDENGNVCDNLDIPYVKQDGGITNRNVDIAVWNLKEITLPSGGKIEVKYEPDDYAYVQNKVAQQMTRIASLQATTVSNIIDADGPNRKVYFDLEEPINKYIDEISVLKTDPELQKEVTDKYIDPTKKIFFKVYMKLRGANESPEDFVSGYADVASASVDKTIVDGNFYTRGYVELRNLRIGGKTIQYHPFSVAAWQHLRTNQPQLLSVGNYTSDPNTSEGQREAKIRGLISIVGEVRNMFGGFYSRANQANWGEQLILNKSFIRLKSPDKKKYGGGVRVKEIVLSDEWDTSTSPSETKSRYGQTYTYTMEEDGQEISSGVAAYEPMIGGEEIALRTAKGYSEEIPLMTSNNLFFEQPVNESYYPGPTVGYRKVTVKSLATAYSGKTGGEDPSNYQIPSDIMTTGATVHEFYTAKDFPVIANETEIDKRPFKLFIPIPLLGQITVNHLTATQGYSIELNDMHGKLRQVSNYQQDANGAVIPEPISWIKYNYKADAVFSDRKRTEDYYVLNNNVETLVSDKNGYTNIQTRTMGQDYEFFTDMRESRTFSTVGGLTLNTDILFIGPFPLPMFMPWPNFGTSTTQVRTAVTNKIIHRSGILMSTEAYDGSSKVKTENKLFDALTGQPLLITVTNNYEDPIYNYNIPAHFAYEDMGPAYKNIGLRFTVTLSATSDTKKYTVLASAAPSQHLIPGDEFIIGNTKGVFVEKSGTNLVFNTEATGQAGSKNFLLIRSGRRNHLSTNVGNITALSDPTLNANRTPNECSVVKNFPKEVPTKYKRHISLGAYEFINSMNTLIGQIRNNTYLPSCPSSLGLNVVAQNAPGNYYMVMPITRSQTICSGNESGYSYPILSYSLAAGKFNGFFESNYAWHGNCVPASAYTYESVTCAACCCYDFKFVALADNGDLSEIPLNTIESIYDPFVDYNVNANYNSSFPNFNTLHQNWDNQSAMGVCFHVRVNVNGVQSVKKAFMYEATYCDPIKFKTVPDPSLPVLIVDPETLIINTKKINNVLNTSSGVFSNTWPMDNSTLRGKNIWTTTTRTDFYNKNSYLNGSQGIWRGEESFVYSKERKQNTDLTTKTDGAYDNLTLFDWSNPLAINCDPAWKKVNTITDYSPYSYEIENKDILGTHSSALYGYNGDLVTVVASNAKTSEIAFEGFEEFDPSTAMNTPTGTEINMNNYGSGNFSFFTQAPTGTINVYHNYNIVSANKNFLIIDKPFDRNFKLTDADVKGTVIDGGTNHGKSISGKYAIISSESVPNNSQQTLLTLDPAQFTATGLWIGSGKFRLAVSEFTPNATIPNSTGYGVYPTTTIAHTGKQSLYVRGGTEVEQRRLNVVPGKKYHFSCWVSQNNSNIATHSSVSGYNVPTVVIKFYDVNHTLITGVTNAFNIPITGNIIELWQKMERTFTVPLNAASMIISLNGGGNPGGAMHAYFDDLRIHPFESNMQSYVYSKTDYKLRAILDNNNYATFYYYDAKGNLFLIKKETERGVHTIQESVSHQKEQ